MEQLTVTQVDTDELTMNDLARVFHPHRSPPFLQVSPADCRRLCVWGQSDEDLHGRRCLVGPVWRRGRGVSSLLSWAHHERRSRER